jgi:hypothetical protein
MLGDLAREKGSQEVDLIFTMAAGETEDWNVCIRSIALHPGCFTYLSVGRCEHDPLNKTEYSQMLPHAPILTHI